MCLAPGSALTARENRKNHVKTCKMYIRWRPAAAGSFWRRTSLPPPNLQRGARVRVCAVHELVGFVPFVGYCHKVNACVVVCSLSPRALSLTAALRVRAHGENESAALYGVSGRRGRRLGGR